MRFVGEYLDMAVGVKSSAEERSEGIKGLHSHVFGFGHETTDDGAPIDKGPMSDWAISKGKAGTDVISQHLFYVRKSEKEAAAKGEARRIQKLDKVGKYKNVIAPYLALNDAPLVVSNI